MKKYALALLLCWLPLAVSAQDLPTGWFFGAGTGVNFGFDGLKFDDRPTSHNGAGFAGDFYLGGWFTRGFGFRAGYQGFRISDRYTDFGNRPYRYIHGDFLFRAHRNIVPYVHAGYVGIQTGSLAGGAGIMVPIHLGKYVSIVPDVKATAFGSKAFQTSERNVSVTLSATIGVAVNLPGRKRKVETPDEPAILPLTIVHDTLIVHEKEVIRDTVYVKPQKDTIFVLPKVLETDFINAEALFDVDSDILRVEALPRLDKVAEWFQAHPSARAEIEGHTDSTASAAYNMNLSERRALSVYNYLVSRGISPDRLTYRGYGLTRPRDTNATPEGRQRNRRVEIKVL